MSIDRRYLAVLLGIIALNFFGPISVYSQTMKSGNQPSSSPTLQSSGTSSQASQPPASQQKLSPTSSPSSLSGTSQSPLQPRSGSQPGAGMQPQQSPQTVPPAGQSQTQPPASPPVQPPASSGQASPSPAEQVSTPGADAQPPPVQGTPPVAAIQGPCIIKVSEDRTAVAILDQSGQAVNHITLGQDRVQKIFKTSDENWNVVLFKIRRQSQFGGIPVNLQKCEPQETREFPAAPESIEFENEQMIVKFPGGKMERFPIAQKNGSK